MTEIPLQLAQRCEPCPLLKEVPDGRICLSCGRGRTWHGFWPLIILTVAYVLLLRFTAMILGADFWSIDRDFQTREGRPFWRLEPLADYCMFPIGLNENPAQVGVVAGLMGVCILTPLLAARMYGLIAGFGFGAMSIVFGSFPWLSLSLIPGIWLLGSKLQIARKKIVFPVALTPVVIYTIAAFLLTRPEETLSRSPMERWAVFFPSLLAVPGAALVGWFLMWYGRVLKFRAWAMLPPWSVAAAVPVLIFSILIGMSELKFTMLARYHRPDVRFHTVPGTAKLAEHLRLCGIEDFAAWFDDDVAPEALDAHRIENILLPQMQRETRRACRDFVKLFPNSPHVPEVLYYRGLTADMVFDRILFEETGQIRFDAGLPNAGAASLPDWRRLVTEYPDHPLSVPARFRLALFAGMQAQNAAAAGRLEPALGRAREAIHRLDELIRFGETYQTPEPGPTGHAGLDPILVSFGFSPPPNHVKLVSAVLSEARRYRQELQMRFYPAARRAGESNGNGARN
jgi:hypothetical protein